MILVQPQNVWNMNKFGLALHIALTEEKTLVVVKSDGSFLGFLNQQGNLCSSAFNFQTSLKEAEEARTLFENSSLMIFTSNYKQNPVKVSLLGGIGNWYFRVEEKECPGNFVGILGPKCKTKLRNFPYKNTFPSVQEAIKKAKEFFNLEINVPYIPEF